MRWCRKDLSVYPLRPPNLDALHEFEADEIRMLHLGFMEGAVAGLVSFLNGGFPVIVPVLLIAMSAEERNTVSIICGSAPVRNAIMAHRAQSALGCLVVKVLKIQREFTIW